MSTGSTSLIQCKYDTISEGVSHIGSSDVWRNGAFHRNEKQIRRNHEMFDENERTLARHHSMLKKRKMECLLDPKRSIAIPSKHLRFPSGVYNPADSYTSQPTAARNDDEAEETDDKFTYA
ncbi:hypothetical protein Scep_029917 [Stephania cephalantha]|uniref:Uncharacterized protein n=1 Tax=Stephania cephalantha TaxID=152367 RepID=A0AAP0HGE7_9MAGN